MTERKKTRQVSVGNVKIGGGNFCLMAGPCSVESEEQIVAVAKAVKASGADMLRGGAFKPRTSPYDFAGLKAQGLEFLKVARQETGLPIVTEIMSIVDPSHATGINRLVSPMALAAAACGADGLIIEVHNDPAHARCDGAQSQTPEMFAATMERVKKVREAVCSC